MIIYRIECFDGTGPWMYPKAGVYYCGGDVEYPGNDGGTLAEAYNAGLLEPYVFGVRERERLYIDNPTALTPETYRSLALNGYGVSVYDCPARHVLEGGTQVAFKREEAKWLSWTPILEEGGCDDTRRIDNPSRDFSLANSGSMGYDTVVASAVAEAA